MKIRVTTHDMELVNAGYRVGEVHEVTPNVALKLVMRGGVEVIEEGDIAENAIESAPENKMEKRGPGRPRKAVQ